MSWKSWAVVAIISYGIYFALNYFIVDPTAADRPHSCSNCSEALIYSDCVHKRSILRGLVFLLSSPDGYAEEYMGCERFRPAELVLRPEEAEAAA